VSHVVRIQLTANDPGRPSRQIDRTRIAASAERSRLHRTDANDAGNAGERLADLRDVRSEAVGGVTGLAGADRGVHEVRSIEADIRESQMFERPAEEPRRDHRRQRQGDLHRHEKSRKP
jgi:hypothetical protein